MTPSVGNVGACHCGPGITPVNSAKASKAPVEACLLHYLTFIWRELQYLRREGDSRLNHQVTWNRFQKSLASQ
jgi:hypothetical protein